MMTLLARRAAYRRSAHVLGDARRTAGGRAAAAQSATAGRSGRECSERNRRCFSRCRASRGRIDIPDKKSERAHTGPPVGSGDYFHEVILRWLGAIVILGMIVLLALAYLVIGRIRISSGRFRQKRYADSLGSSASHIG